MTHKVIPFNLSPSVHSVFCVLFTFYSVNLSLCYTLWVSSLKDPTAVAWPGVGIGRPTRQSWCYFFPIFFAASTFRTAPQLTLLERALGSRCRRHFGRRFNLSPGRRSPWRSETQTPVRSQAGLPPSTAGG